MSLHWYGRRERGRLRGCGDSGLFAEEIVEPEAAVAGWAAESIHAVVGRGEAVVSVLEGFCVRERVRHAGIVEGLAHAFVPIGHGGLGDGARTAMGATQTAGVAEDPARPVDVLVVRTEHGRRGRARSRRRRASDGWRAGAWAWAARPGSTVVAGTGCGPRMDAGLRTLRCSTPDAPPRAPPAPHLHLPRAPPLCNFQCPWLVLAASSSQVAVPRPISQPSTARDMRPASACPSRDQ